MQVEVTREDQNVFLTVNGISATSETAARVYQGLAFTWEVEQLVRYRHQARAEVVREIVVMLDERISVYEQKRDKADPLADETYNRHEAITYVLEALEIVKLGMAKFGGKQ